MESGMNALNIIKETRNRFLAIQKSSKQIFEETIAKINELKRYNEQITQNKLLLEKHKLTIPMCEMEDLLSDEKITALETILNDKKQNNDEQEALLKEDQQNILSARLTHCDRVYKYLNENRTIQVQSTTHTNSLKELNDLRKKILHYENELKMLNENILDKESSSSDLQALQKVQKNEERKYQELLMEKKETLKNLTQRVKHLKFNRRKNEVNHTIENLYHRNNNTNFSSTNSTLEDKVSNYFDSSATADVLKQSDALNNKIKSLRASKTFKSNSKSCEPIITDPVSTSSLDEFDSNVVKRCKVNENMFFSTNSFASSTTSSSSEDSNKTHEIRNIAENTRRKFIPKKPIFSSKLK